MADKNIRSRMQQKHDISSNWALAVNFIPLAGEIIVYSDLNKFKIGDGVNKVSDLPFATSDIQVDQTYNATSTNPQSGIAVSQAIATKSKVESSNTNGNIKIDGTETTVYTHPATHTGKFTPEVSVTGASYKPAGTVAAPTITVTPSTTYIKATASGTAVTPSATKDVLTGVKASSNDVVLGEATTFTTTVTPSTTNIKATASGTAVGANGTATVVKSYPGATSKLVKTSVGSASGWSAGSLPSLGTAISADDITAWSAGSHTASIQPTVVTSASVSGTTLSITTGTQSHAYTAPSLSYTARSIPNVTGVGTLPSLTVTSTSVATGALDTNGTGSSVMTGLGTASTETVLTGVKVTSQPTVTLATGATAGTGVVSVATGISSASTSAGTNDKVTAITGVTGNGTATAITGLSVTQPTITLDTDTTSGTGKVQVATGIASAAATQPVFTGTQATITPTVTGVEGDVTVS